MIRVSCTQSNKALIYCIFRAFAGGKRTSFIHSLTLCTHDYSSCSSTSFTLAGDAAAVHSTIPLALWWICACTYQHCLSCVAINRDEQHKNPNFFLFLLLFCKQHKCSSWGRWSTQRELRINMFNCNTKVSKDIITALTKRRGIAARPTRERTLYKKAVGLVIVGGSAVVVMVA